MPHKLLFLSQWAVAEESLLPGGFLIPLFSAQSPAFMSSTRLRVRRQTFDVCVSPRQHRGRVRAYGGRRGDVQGVSHPPQKPEDPGRGCDDHPPEPGHQTRNLVGSDYQLLGRRLQTGFHFSFTWAILFRGREVGGWMGADVCYAGGVLETGTRQG